MTKSTRNLMHQRYGKPVLWACLLIIGFLIFSAVSFTNSWTAESDRLNSEEFLEDFTSDSFNFTRWYDEEDQEVPQKNLERYKRNLLSLFQMSVADKMNQELWARSYDKEYDATQTYRWNKFTLVLRVPAVTFLFIGFLLFFVDLYSNFNAFLFSSGISRKNLFLGKILFVGVPTLASYLIGFLVQLGIIYLRIPNVYINAPFSVLLSNMFGTFCIACCYFAAGCFIGVLTGNVLLSVLTVTGFGLLSTVIPYTVEALIDSVVTLRTGNRFYLSSTVVESFFPHGLKKSAGMWQSWLTFLLLTLFILWISEKAYEKISLESKGNYILLRKWRVGIFVLMWGFISFITITHNDPILEYYLSISGENVRAPLAILLDAVGWVLMIGLFCGILIYFTDIKAKINRWRKIKAG